MSNYGKETDCKNTSVVASNKPSGEELPIDLSLDGSEPYFQEFCLGADDVMKRLGIKRSRLRQISGDQLRVGRKKVDRFIRPFYRICDVNNYLEWTRASASHLKSSKVIEESTRVFNQTWEEFTSQNFARWQKFEDLLCTKIESLFQALQEIKDNQVEMTRWVSYEKNFEEKVARGVHLFHQVSRDLLNSKKEVLDQIRTESTLISTLHNNWQLKQSQENYSQKKMAKEVLDQATSQKEALKKLENKVENIHKVLDNLPRTREKKHIISRSRTSKNFFFEDSKKLKIHQLLKKIKSNPNIQENLKPQKKTRDHHARKATICRLRNRRNRSSTNRF